MDHCGSCWQYVPLPVCRPRMCLYLVPAPPRMRSTCSQIDSAVHSCVSCCLLQGAALGVRLETLNSDEAVAEEQPFHGEAVLVEKQYAQRPSQAPRRLLGPTGSVHPD